jgi:flagellar biosynthesis chaperone FliJ
MKDMLISDLDVYRKSVSEKANFLQQLKQTIVKTEAEINMLNGAIQACEKLLENDDAAGKTDRK